MFSCANWQRGCRARCDIAGGKCKECNMYNLRTQPQPSSSPFNYQSHLSMSGPVNMQRPSILSNMFESRTQSQILRRDVELPDGIDR